MAQTFDHRAVFDPLMNRRDTLDGLHANTQIPKIIGAAREFELTGEPRYRTIATTFGTRVAKYRPTPTADTATTNTSSRSISFRRTWARSRRRRATPTTC
jgi:hypothetical protein